MKRKGSVVGSSTVQFLEMPDVTIPSHHKGLRDSLEAEYAAKKMHPNFFPDSSSLGNSYGFTSLCGVYERPLIVFVSLFVGNLRVQYNRQNYKITEIRDSYGTDP